MILLCMIILTTLVIARVHADQCDKYPFKLIPDFSKLEINTDDSLFKYGITKKTWEMDAMALAWRKEDIKDDSYVIDDRFWS